MTKYFAALLIFFVAWPSFAADINGYTAQYECRAGGPNCNVDVVGLTDPVAHPCDVTITTADSLSTINKKLSGAGQFFCITNGDYTSKGRFTVTASGTSGAYKVLRYTRSGDDNDEPWNQPSGNQAKISDIDVSGAYWIIHRLSFVPPTATSDNIVHLNADNIIFDHNLVVGPYNTNSGIAVDNSGVSNVTIQNNVARNGDPSHPAFSEPHGISPSDGTNIHIVNNEVYDWEGHDIQVGRNEQPTMAGFVVENNDLYDTSAVWKSDGRMNAKDPLDIKADGTSGNPAKIIHNRVWGSRVTDTDTCCINITPGVGINVVTPSPYILIQNNIIFENQVGLLWAYSTASHQSVIGNLFYNNNKFYSGYDSNSLEVGQITTTEVYLNTFIGGTYTYVGYGLGNTDIRCNVFLSETVTQNGTPDSGTQMDNNVFYDSNVVTYNGTGTNVHNVISTRANSTAYSLNAILRTAPVTNCSSGAQSACFLYKVTTAGTAASSSPTYCTTLGCTQTDGSLTLQAVRAPYTFRRKLRTVAGGESYTIPYARVHASAPETNTCPSSYASRRGIGINDVN